MSADSLDNLVNEQPRIDVRRAPAKSGPKPVELFARFRGFALATLVLILCFSVPLFHLVKFAAPSQLYSYILLIPFVSLYLVWCRRTSLPRSSEPASGLAMVLVIAGAAVFTGHWMAIHSDWELTTEDRLALTTGSFLFFFLSICCLFLGREKLRAMVFPLCFLVFMVPLPTVLRESIETLLQHGSAAAAYAMFKLSGTPVFRTGLHFQLPGFSLEVAPECSGIHSTLVLFLTSLLAGHVFLRTPWKRAMLAAPVIPLGLLRNGFRVFTIGQLCVHIGPEMIRSPIHRHGGPLFFALSLVPFFLLLIPLWRSDRVGRKW